MDALRSIIEYLCSEPCAGRETGTPEGKEARRYIQERFEEIGLEPAAPNGTFLQPIPFVDGANVIGRIPGHGPKRERAVLLAAHYDHLGTKGTPETTYWGADDNAAAVAILIETAAALKAIEERLDRQVLIVAFDAEEPPHFLGQTMGSVHFVEKEAFPLDQIDMMVCMDLVGHGFGPPGLPDDVRSSLFVLGAEKSEGTPALVDAIDIEGLRPRRIGIHVIPSLSDYHAFRQAEVPFLFLSCGRWDHYHAPTDTPEKLDYEKIARTRSFLTALGSELSRRPEAPVRYLMRGEDDSATIENLSELGRLLADELSIAKGIERVVAPLRDKLSEGEALTLMDRGTLAFLIIQLEQHLSY